MKYQLRAERNKSLSVTEQIFMNRGLALEDIYHFLHTSENDVLEPSTIAHMRDGAKILVEALQKSKRTFIQIDSDCDGYTSAALLINYLNRIAPYFVNNYLFYDVQDGKEHGIFIDKIPPNIELVIAPDSSSNDYEVHRTLKEKGIDVLVIDHHEADHVSEYACVINNQLCDYPTKSLSGVGMVYKFCSYIDELLNKDYAKDYLDLVAIGLDCLLA
jgi:single-stranded-DNA-specific exonuclease